MTLKWDDLVAPVRGASAFWTGLSKVFPLVQELFFAQLGDGARFRFWSDAWSPYGRLQETYPRLFALARHRQASVKECWAGVWSPIFVAHLSNQRVAEFLRFLEVLDNQRPTEGASDGWVWAYGPFSVRGVYRRLRTLQIDDPVILRACQSVWKQRIPLKVTLFCMGAS